MTTPRVGPSESQRDAGARPRLGLGARTGLTWRSLPLAFVLAAGLVAITPYNDYVLGNTYIAGNHFPVGAVFSLLVLSLLNFALYRARGRRLLTPREMAVVYIIIMVTSGIPSSGLLRYIIPSGTVPYYFANAGNRWNSLFWDYIPSWLAVSDHNAAFWFWEGLPAGAHIPWMPWVNMLSHWAIFFVALWLVMFSLSALVRKQWADRERLTFPLVQFPLEVLRDDEAGLPGSFFRNRLVWIGAAFVFVIHIVNGLHRHYPAVPEIPTFITTYNSFPDRPWNALHPVYIAFFFSAIGFGYLLSLEVAAGFWVSVIYMKVQGVILSAIGYEGGSAWGGTISDITVHQQMGGLLAMSAVLFWLLRGSLADAFRKAFSRAPEVDDRNEPLSYRTAVFGLLIGLVVSFGWLVAAGMTPIFAAVYLSFFLCIILVLTRIIAEAGMLMIHFSFGVTEGLMMVGGSTVLGPANLTALTFVDCGLGFDLREFLMPSVLNAFRLSDLTGVPARRTVPILWVALIVCVIVAVPAFLITCYLPGALQMGNIGELQYHPERFFGALANNLLTPVKPSALQYISMAAGALMVAGLAWLRINFVWWPIHPLGFVMATSWASLNLWFSLFLGWLFKLLTIHYGGLRGYRQIRPLFLGIILGDIMGSVLWNIVGFCTGVGFMVTVN
jgi:hypothetical protein